MNTNLQIKDTENNYPHFAEKKGANFLPSPSPYRVPCGIATEIIKHPQRKALYFYLDLKTLFVNGIIRNEGGNKPYKRIAAMLKLSPESCRNKLQRLRKLKLIKYDKFNNVSLASFRSFAAIFGTTARKKHTILNTAGTYRVGEYGRSRSQGRAKNVMNAELAVKAIAIKDNLAAQAKKVREKIIDNEIKNIVAERFIQQNATKPGGCCSVETELAMMSKGERRRLAKCFNLERLLKRQMKAWESQIQQVSFGYPSINPNVTLSCKGTARITGGRSASQGRYLQQRLRRAGMIDIHRDILQIPITSPAIYERTLDMRSDVFRSTNKPMSINLDRLYFLRLPNLLTMKTDTILK